MESETEYVKKELEIDIKPTELNNENQSSTPLPDLELVQKTIFFENDDRATFRIAKPFEIKIAAEGLGKARFITKSPDGRIFVPDLVNYKLSHEGSIAFLEDFNEETGTFKTKKIYLSRLRGPNDILFYKDDDGYGWIYIALTAHLIRYPYKDGDDTPSGEPEIIIDFPNKQSPGEVSVVWHITRTLSLHNDRIYISVGSGCNACEELAGTFRGMVYSINPDGSDLRVYADGLRNAVGVEWAEDKLYVTANGVDHLGDNAPDEMMYELSEGEHYGWPYCYESNDMAIQDTSQNWNNQPFSCLVAPRPLTTFNPHAAPLGLEYFENFHPTLNGSFLVALHGSFDKTVRSGYQIVRVSKDGEQEVFMDGFQTDNDNRVGRPVDILQHNGSSFFFTDDHGGRLYYVYIK